MVRRLQAFGELRRLQDSGGIALASTSEGSGAGRKGQMSGMWDHAMDVVMAVRDWQSESDTLARLLDFMWRDGSEQVLVSVTYLLKSGEVVRRQATKVRDERLSGGSGWVIVDPPARFVKEIPSYGYVSTYDLDRFDAPEVDELIARFYPRGLASLDHHRRVFLERLHGDFGAFLAIRTDGARETETIDDTDQEEDALAELTDDGADGLPIYGRIDGREKARLLSCEENPDAA